jgi:MFS family permease
MGFTPVNQAVAACYFGMGLVFASWASRIPYIKSSLQLSDGQLGQILLALPAGQLLSMGLAAWLEQRWGSRRLGQRGMLFYLLALLSVGLAPHPLVLACALLAFGGFGNLTGLAINTQAVLAEKEAGRPLMASFHGCWSLAGFAGALLGLGLHRQTVLFHFGLVAALVATLTLAVSPHLLEGGSSLERKGWKWDAALLPLSLIGFCSLATEGAMFDWSGVYFRQVVHAPGGLVLLGYAAFMVCMATGRFVGDRLIARWGQAVALRRSGLLMSAGLFAAVLFPRIVPATVAFMLVGFAVSSVIPIVYSLAGRSARVEPGTALATVSGLSYLGFLLGPPLIGGLASAFSLRVSYAVIGLFGLCIAYLGKEAKA